MHQKQNLNLFFIYFSIWSTNFTYIVAENGEISFLTNNFHGTKGKGTALLSCGSATSILIHTLEDSSVRSPFIAQ
jgi:hypothetical protein